MTLQVSTGFKTKILGRESFADIFDGGTIRIFSGAQPATADHAETGTLLGLVTVGGGAWSAENTAAGLHYLQIDEFVTNSAFESWLFRAEQSGVVGWFRVVGPAEDDGQPSYNLPRIDGSVGVLPIAAQLYMITLSVTAGYSYSIDSFVYAILPLRS